MYTMKFSITAPHRVSCPIEVVTELLGGKWKLVIMDHLITEGVLRFSDLRRAIPGITQKMLTQQLRELETDNLISRKVYPVVPPKVEYTPTALGISLKPLCQSMKEWGEAYNSARSQD